MVAVAATIITHGIGCAAVALNTKAQKGEPSACLAALLYLSRLLLGSRR